MERIFDTCHGHHGCRRCVILTDAQRTTHNAQRTPRWVPTFSTCTANYTEPGIGHDLASNLVATTPTILRTT